MTEYQERSYRHRLRHERLVAFEVSVRETDLLILAGTNLAAHAEEIVYKVRGPLENYIAQHPEFLHAMTPLPDDKLAPPIAREMLSAAKTCGTGPMAAVAGAIAEHAAEIVISGSSNGKIVGSAFCSGSLGLHVNIINNAVMAKSNLNLNMIYLPQILDACR